MGTCPRGGPDIAQEHVAAEANTAAYDLVVAL
jgi:hypothetical protein